VHTCAPDDAAAAHRILTALEIEAVKSARPTPAADDLISTIRSSGRTLTVVSNNSADAIARYCLDHDLGYRITHIVGRDPDTTLMKPDPHLINVALAALRATPAEAVFIGDSPSDITAGHLARVPVIGYANKPGKGARLAESAADAVTGGLLHISAALTDTKA
jgi:HAD superfamily hydrolase (TIGR01509 family)